jgi:membrane-associated phospholipid phosphatase
MLVTATSYAVMTLFVKSIKYSVCEPRPDTGAWDAFPSGHTAKAMTAAEIVRVEYGPWWGLGAYALGLGTAYLRLYNDRHWVNDVICGTGIGILSARIGYWLLPVESRLLDRWSAGHADDSPAMAAVPVCDPITRSVGLSLSVVF